MLEQLLVWERDAFFMLNGSDSAFLDRFMWIYSGKAVWLPLAFFILVVLCYKKNWKEWLLILLAIVLTITLCDQFASHVCKPIFTRFRPTHHPGSGKGGVRLSGRYVWIYLQPCGECFRLCDLDGADLQE